jgi:hypothetical protein
MTLPNDIIDVTEKWCHQAEPEEFKRIVSAALKRFKSEFYNLKVYIKSKEKFEAWILAIKSTYEMHLEDFETRFSDESGFPHLVENKPVLKAAFQEILSLLQSFEEKQPKWTVFLNNFCAAVFIVVTHAGLKLKNPGKGRNAGKDKNEYRKFAKLCISILEGNDITETLRDFETPPSDTKKVQEDIQQILAKIVDRQPKVSGSSKIQDMLQKHFGFFEAGEEGKKIKGIQIKDLLKGTTCAGINPKTYLTEPSYKALIGLQ